MFNDNCAAEYAYNADGLRILKSVTKGGATTAEKFLYEGKRQTGHHIDT